MDLSSQGRNWVCYLWEGRYQVPPPEKKGFISQSLKLQDFFGGVEKITPPLITHYLCNYESR